MSVRFSSFEMFLWSIPGTSASRGCIIFRVPKLKQTHLRQLLFHPRLNPRPAFRRHLRPQLFKASSHTITLLLFLLRRRD
jgi:hypothetical protein